MEHEIDRENRDWEQVDREIRDWEKTIEYEIDHENRDWEQATQEYWREQNQTRTWNSLNFVGLNFVGPVARPLRS